MMHVTTLLICDAVRAAAVQLGPERRFDVGIANRSFWMRVAGLIAVMLLFLGPLKCDIQAQFVRFSVNTQPDVSFVATDPIELLEIEEANMGDMGMGDTGMNNMAVSMENEESQSFSCMAIGSGENIHVLVHTELTDTFVAEGRQRPVSIDARYINDRGGCPQSPEMAVAISVPFEDGGRASFRLDQAPVTRASMSTDRFGNRMVNARNTRFFIAYLFLNLTRTFDPDAGAVDRSKDLEYRGTYSVDIIYL